VLHAHETTPPTEKVIAADLPQRGRALALTGLGSNEAVNEKSHNPLGSGSLELKICYLFTQRPRADRGKTQEVNED
jgi:hypothetical protein